MTSHQLKLTKRVKGFSGFLCFVLLFCNMLFVYKTGANGFETVKGKYYVKCKSFKREVSKQEYGRLKTMGSLLSNSLLASFAIFALSAFAAHKRDDVKEDEAQIDTTSNDNQSSAWK